MRLIYLSPVPWASFAQRPHKFVDWFHAKFDGPVLWIDPYPTRFPNWKDIRRPSQATSTSNVNLAPDWLTIYKPVSMPIEPAPGSGWINRLFWRSLFQEVDNFTRGNEALLAIGKPSLLAWQLLARMSQLPSMYDAMDDFPVFYSGISRIAMAHRERKIARRVDLIWASSTALKSRWAVDNQNVQLVHNALDRRAIDGVKLPLKTNKKRIFGYVGTIASWFDWDWVFELARIRPNDEIRLIGPIFNQPSRTVSSNIVILPACNHSEAIAAMAKFDVALIPFKKNILTESVDPIKYYEFRALGLPQISTDFGEMRLREAEPGVFISKSLVDLPDLVSSALQFNATQFATADFVLGNNWHARFDSAKLFDQS